VWGALRSTRLFLLKITVAYPHLIIEIPAMIYLRVLQKIKTVVVGGGAATLHTLPQKWVLFLA
jgi:hypothetical protein